MKIYCISITFSIESSMEDFSLSEVDFMGNLQLLYVVFSLDDANLVYTKSEAGISTEGMYRGINQIDTFCIRK